MFFSLTVKNDLLVKKMIHYGYSISDLSRETNLSRQSIYNMIKGKRVAPKNAVLISQALDCAVEDLFNLKSAWR